MFFNRLFIPSYYTILFLPLILACLAFSIYASFKVRSSFSKYDKIKTRSGLTGYDTATRLLRRNGVGDILVGKVKGNLTDHYHPKKGVVNLSNATYDSDSVAAVAVAAHEIGHVMQSRDSYLPYKLRTAIVPIANFGPFLAMPLVLIGLFIDLYATNVDPTLGFKLAILGVILYGASFLFTLITFPVELNASRRALKMLVDEGILTEEEKSSARKMLYAAALTYFAALMTSLVYFLRFLFMVLSMFGGGRRRN